MSAAVVQIEAFRTDADTVPLVAGSNRVRMYLNPATGTFYKSENGGAYAAIPASGSGGTVTSITGTANQVTVSAAVGAVTLSLPNPVVRDLTGNVTGNVTGNTSGSAGSCTGLAATATALATPRNINGVAFDGTAAITVPAAGSTLTDTATVAKGGTGGTTVATAQAGLGMQLKARTGTQTVTNSTSLTADDTLIFNVVNGVTYRFDIFYALTCVTTSGAKLDINGGAATVANLHWTSFGWASSSASWSTTDSTALTTSSGATARVTYVRMTGVFTASSTDTFIPRFAQNAETGAAENVVAAINSWGMVEQIG